MPKNIELIDAWRRMPGRNLTYNHACDTVAKIKQGRAFVYAVPYGIDWECEGGHHIKILNQAAFDAEYSLVQLK